LPPYATAARRAIPSWATAIWLATVAHSGLSLAVVVHDGSPPNPWGPRATSEPSWPTAVSVETAMGHCGRRGARQMDVKSVKFSSRHIFLQNDL
jgi:hypothetical protein